MKEPAEVVMVSFNTAHTLRPGDVMTDVDAPLTWWHAHRVAGGLNFFRVKLCTVVSVTHDVTEIKGTNGQEFFGRSAVERVDVSVAAQGGAFELKTLSFTNFGDFDARPPLSPAAWWVVWRTEG